MILYDIYKRPLAPYLKIIVVVGDTTSSNTSSQLEKKMFQIPSEHILRFEYSVEGGKYSADLSLIDSYNAGRDSNKSPLDELLFTLYNMASNPTLNITWGWQDDTSNRNTENFTVVNFNYNRTERGLGVKLSMVPSGDKIKYEKGTFATNISLENDINNLTFLNKMAISFGNIFYLDFNSLVGSEFKTLKKKLDKAFKDAKKKSSSVVNLQATNYTDCLAHEILTFIYYSDSHAWNCSTYQGSNYSSNKSKILAKASYGFLIISKLLTGTADVFEQGKTWSSIKNPILRQELKAAVSLWIANRINGSTKDYNKFKENMLSLASNIDLIDNNIAFIAYSNPYNAANNMNSTFFTGNTNATDIEVKFINWNILHNKINDLKKQLNVKGGYTVLEIINMLINKYNKYSPNTRKIKIDTQIDFINADLIENNNYPKSGTTMTLKRIKKFPCANKTFAQSMDLLFDSYLSLEPESSDDTGVFTNTIYKWYLIPEDTKTSNGKLKLVIKGTTKNLQTQQPEIKREYFLGGKQTNIFNFSYTDGSSALSLFQNILNQESIKIYAQDKNVSQTIYLQKNKKAKKNKNKGKAMTITTSSSNIANETSYSIELNSHLINKIKKNNVTELKKIMRKPTSVNSQSENPNWSGLPQRGYVNLLSNNWSATSAGAVLLKKIYEKQKDNYVPKITFSTFGDPAYSLSYIKDKDKDKHKDKVITLQDIISVEVLNVNGEINHLLTRNYFIMGFKHEISAGKFITTITAMKYD